MLDFHSGGKTLDFLPFCAAHILPDKAQEAEGLRRRRGVLGALVDEDAGDRCGRHVRHGGRGDGQGLRHHRARRRRHRARRDGAASPGAACSTCCAMPASSPATVETPPTRWLDMPSGDCFAFAEDERHDRDDGRSRRAGREGRRSSPASTASAAPALAPQEIRAKMSGHAGGAAFPRPGQGGRLRVGDCGGGGLALARAGAHCALQHMHVCHAQRILARIMGRAYFIPSRPSILPDAMPTAECGAPPPAPHLRSNPPHLLPRRVFFAFFRAHRQVPVAHPCLPRHRARERHPVASRNMRTPGPGSMPCTDTSMAEREARDARRASLKQRGGKEWCCERGLNSRPLPYQGSALPLSYRSLRMRRTSAISIRQRKACVGSCGRPVAATTRPQ